MEKVSVIVPVYNGENSIKRCADSILNQDYPDLELLLVDDGSRDRSWEIMQAIAAAAAGLVQVAVLFPLEKYVLFKKE